MHYVVLVLFFMVFAHTQTIAVRVIACLVFYGQFYASSVRWFGDWCIS